MYKLITSKYQKLDLSPFCTKQNFTHLQIIFQGLSDYLIFGDDADFMRRMVEELTKSSTGQKGLFSTNPEEIDFYLASRACGAMLITAPTSTFGWWLAFFTPNQNAVFYSNDKRPMADKVPQKDLFL
ncbi:hypothetical protein GCK32_004600 [Trichostrongylus colubriformis]|uniref:L-Fucosyltransferase n=1 Tax=Trichostrongylus colubriformis TaxID=6319 RepID=A0AAN8FU75_TRICO